MNDCPWYSTFVLRTRNQTLWNASFQFICSCGEVGQKWQHADEAQLEWTQHRDASIDVDLVSTP